MINVVDPERREQKRADVNEHRQEEHAGEHHEENALENLAIVDLAQSDPDEGENGSDTWLPESRGLRANTTVWADFGFGVYVAAAVLTVLPRSACRRADRMSLCGGLRLGSLPLGRGWPPAESGPLRIAPLTKGSARTGRGWYATMGT
jgi:hypothetical protein